MAEPFDFEKMMREDAQPPKLRPEVQERLTKLYEGSAGEAGLKTRYCWVRAHFRTAGVNNADVDELVNETFHKYLDRIENVLWACARGENDIEDEDTSMPAIRWVAEQLGRSPYQTYKEVFLEHKHQELVDRFYDYDKLAEEDLEEEWGRAEILSKMEVRFPPAPQQARPQPRKPVDLEKRAYESPKAVMKKIAQNVLVDYFRKKEPNAGKETGSLEDVLEEDQPASLEPNQYELMCFRETHSRYLNAVRELPSVQRAAWILCRDPLLLTVAEAEELLSPALSRRRAKRAVQQRPLSGKEAASVFGHDVSPDVRKAAEKLEKALRS